MLPRLDHVLYADTGLYPAATEQHLKRVHALSHQAGAEFARADATDLAERVWTQTPAPLPLFTDGEPARLPSGCADTQLLALTSRLRTWLEQGPAEVECVLGLGAEYAHRVPPAATWPGWLRLDYPLFGLGWRERDCAAFNHHHGLGAMRGLACLGCPERSDADWAELRESDPCAWDEAVALDGAVRHHTTETVTPGMPPAEAGYIHPCRRPLADIDPAPEQEGPLPGCLPRAFRGLHPGNFGNGGDDP